MEEHEVDHLFVNDSNGLSEGYCSYFFGDLAIGPRMVVWWFREHEIDDLVEIENETGLKIFPRYVFYDSLYEPIENFCWKHHLWLDLIEYYRSLPGIEFNEVDHVPTKKRIKKHYDFLSILDIRPPQQGRSFPTSFDLLVHSFQTSNSSGLQASLDDVKTQERSITQNGIHHKDVITQLWEGFTKEDVQETLSILSNRFIFDYIELAQRVEFVKDHVWDLKWKYLSQLYETIKSPQKRMRLRSQVPKSEWRKVQKAKALFPNVNIISEDSKIFQIIIKLSQLAQYKKRFPEEIVDILLLGETGTGKELFANAINESSGRKGHCVKVNCSAIPKELFESEFFGYKKGAFSGALEDRKGRFEEADGGTLFLDEIGDLALEFQPRFLRVLEDREIHPIGPSKKGPEPKKVDVIIVFAATKDLRRMVKDSDFRKELFFRIDENTFEIPPLRERQHDVPLLVHHFIESNDKERERNPDLPPIEVSEDCMDSLTKYVWPGNVRELERMIRKIVRNRSFNDDRSALTSADLPPKILDFHLSKKSIPKPTKGKKKRPSDEELIRLEKEGYRRTDVAEKIGVARETVSRWYSNMEKKSDQGD
jgi:transcriptional regulator with PAS, ATPase and Fis domain